jgi:hypothetical protein
MNNVTIDRTRPIAATGQNDIIAYTATSKNILMTSVSGLIRIHDGITKGVRNYQKAKQESNNAINKCDV